MVVWEKRDAPAPWSRAIGIHAPALVALDRAGVAEAVLAEAVTIRRGTATSGGAVLGHVPFDRAHPRYPFVAALPQSRTEALLGARLAELEPHALHRGTSLVGLRDVGDHVQVTGRDRTGGLVEEIARWVVGADGARSAVRDLLGVDAPVRDYPDTYVMGDFAEPGTPAGAGSVALVHLEPAGVVESFPLPGGVRRFVAHSPHPPELTAVWLADLVATRTGTVVDPASATMLSAFGVHRRLACRTVVGRVVLVGDAAHEISPIGGQGMNLGWLDAAALAPLLTAGRGYDTAALRGFERARAASARRAARQAELNMALGRPVHGGRLRARNLALVAALRRPVAGVLASVYAMRWT